MADRKRQIILLLGSRFDFDWFPAGSLKTTSGLTPSERIPCPDCGASDTPGWRLDRFKRPTPCETCGGRLATPERNCKRGRGYVFIDGMDTLRRPVGHRETVAAVETAARPGKRVTCDRCGGDGVWKGDRCGICDGAGTRPAHIFNLRLTRTDLTDVNPEPGDELVAAIDRRNAAGSFRELEKALCAINRRVNKPLRFTALTPNAAETLRLLDDLYLPPASRCEADLSLFERSLVDLALEYLDSLMPDPIVVPAGLAANARERREQLKRVKGLRGMKREQRDQEMRKLARQGRPPQWIAATVGVSVATVYRAVNGQEEDVA